MTHQSTYSAKAASGFVKALEQVGGTEARRVQLPPETTRVVAETLGWIGHYRFLATMLIVKWHTAFPILLWFFTFSAVSSPGKI